MIYLPNQAFHLYSSLQRDFRRIIHQRHLRPRGQQRQQRIWRRIRGRRAGNYPIRAWLCNWYTDLGSLV